MIFVIGTNILFSHIVFYKVTSFQKFLSHIASKAYQTKQVTYVSFTTLTSVYKLTLVMSCREVMLYHDLLLLLNNFSVFLDFVSKTIHISIFHQKYSVFIMTINEFKIIFRNVCRLTLFTKFIFSFLLRNW